MADEFHLLPFLGVENSTNDPNSTIPMNFRDREVNDRKASTAYSNYQYNSHVAREIRVNEASQSEASKPKPRSFQPTGSSAPNSADLRKAPATNFWFAGGGGLESRAADERKTANHMNLHNTLVRTGPTHGDGFGGTRGVTLSGTTGTRGLGSTDVTRAGSDAWGTHDGQRLGQGLTSVVTGNNTYKRSITAKGVMNGPERGVGPVGTDRDNQPHQILRLRQPPPSPQEVAARRQQQNSFPVPQSIINASVGPQSAVTESSNFDGNPRWYASETSDPRQVPFKRVPYAEHYVPIVANDGALAEIGVHKDKKGFERGRGGVDQQWQQSRLDSAQVHGQVDQVLAAQKKEQQQKYREVLEEQVRIKNFQSRQHRHLDTQLGYDSVLPVRVIDRTGGASLGTVRPDNVDGNTTRQFTANRDGAIAGGTTTLVEFGPKDDYVSTIDHVQKNKKYSRPPWVSDANLQRF